MKINEYLQASYVSKVYSKNSKEKWRTFENPYSTTETAELEKKLPVLKKLFKNSARIRVEWVNSNAGSSHMGIHGIRFYFPHEMNWRDVEKLFEVLMQEEKQDKKEKVKVEPITIETEILVPQKKQMTITPGESGKIDVKIEGTDSKEDNVTFVVDENELYDEIIRTLKVGENDTPYGKGYCKNEEDLEKLRTLIRNIRVLDK